MDDIHQDQGPRLLFFGPQVLSSDNQSLERLLSILQDGPIRHWVTQTTDELPTYWNALVTKIPKLRCVPGEQLLADLSVWLTHGLDEEQRHATLPNILLTPLVVLTQLTEYWQYLESSRNGSGNHDPEDLQATLTRQNVRTLGFCTGLLSAFAVSSSKTQQDFEKYGAVAVRLAMLVGAVVDADQVLEKIHGRAKSFSTAWQRIEQRREMARIIDQFPDAYISVLSDEKRATITAMDRTAPVLLNRLRAAGIVATEVGLHGRFHYNQHRDTVDALVELCSADMTLQFADAFQLALPTYSNTSGESLRSGHLHGHALRGILVEQSNWYGTFKSVQTAYVDEARDGLVVSLGQGRFVPPTLKRSLGPRLIHFAPEEDDGDKDDDASQSSATVKDSEPDKANPKKWIRNDNDIAIVGMSIKVAGADDLDEFSEVLRKGESQHEEVTSTRMSFDTLWRGKDERKWYGNFIRDVDAFDHRFFKKSPRESASMDPQQRLYLQAAYQAVEQSGYFAMPNPDKHIGCYLGACAADYEHNVACHPPNAFTATGNLKSFIPGKVSHYFGWTGPAITFDTACSSSAVAIHTAARAMIAGECSAALCGGVATMGNPLWFQNLASASFLSPTGQCKPFDELADGYCRAEGIACVFLKPMAAAIADGNQIFGCISSTAVYQNQNCTPLFVPNAPSLSQLFCDVIQKARLEPKDISYVEAHGTGTPVGDPAEYESIRTALGGPIRPTKLPIGSAKGYIGHTEGASGVVSLIKVAIMIHEGYIPPQASYSKMSHHIHAAPSDMMEVPTSLRPWNEGYKAALINNYGASGSNASMVVTQAPPRDQATGPIHHSVRHVFWIPGHDERSIKEYRGKLVAFIKKAPAATLAALSFNLYRQSNRSLTRGLVFTCGSVLELVETLSGDVVPTEVKSVRPVILCFGGQVSTRVGLDRNLYHSVTIYRKYLDQCNTVIESLGLESIYPEVFSKDPVEDTVKLQTILFSLQYSCAKCWIDCGVKVEAVVGHSFGEITALCISGVLSLKDAVKLVGGRAKIVRDMWGPDPGSMMAVEGDLSVVEELLAEVNGSLSQGGGPVSIACYNGPKSFTLAGTTRAIDAVVEIILVSARFASVKSKRLAVTNAFHSALVEPLIPSLEQIGLDLTFNDPNIPLERATRTRTTSSGLTPKFVSDHLRNPVFFDQAVQRLAKDYPSCIWLEAGSASTITTMARRALGHSSESYFQGVNITNDKGMESIADATTALWKEGLRVAFWAHHGLQTHEYCPLLLPPYQFEKSRHWLEMKVPKLEAASLQGDTNSLQEVGLWTFFGYQDAGERRPRFRINTETDIYKSFVSGHLIAQTAPICPATLEVDMAIEAFTSIRPDFSNQRFHPVIHQMRNHAPLCIDPTRHVWLEYETVEFERQTWAWKIFSTGSDGRSAEMLYVDAKLQFRSLDEGAYHSEFARFERSVSHQKCIEILKDDNADDIIQGRNVYRTFGEIVDYGEIYRGVRKVVGVGDECAGSVQSKHSSKTWLDVPLSDSFSQVSGIWVNCMTDRAPIDMFIASGCELSMRSPKVGDDYPRPEVWHILARHHRVSNKEFITDVFVFDSTSGLLTEVMIGIQYIKVAKASMSKILTRLTADQSRLGSVPDLPAKVHTATESHTGTLPQIGDPLAQSNSILHIKNEKGHDPSRADISGDVRKVMANVSGIEADEIKDDSELADLGIDSLMGMELTREVEVVFGCTLDQGELMEALTFRLLVKCIAHALYGPRTESDSNLSSDTGGLTPQDISSVSSNTTSSAIAGSLATEQLEADIETTESDVSSNLQLSQSDILAAFAEVKMRTDQCIRDHKLDNIDGVIIAQTNRLCAALIVEGFEELGCPLRTATAGQKLERIAHRPEHGRFVEFLYQFLENDARLIDTSGSQIRRTGFSAPRKSSEVLLQELLRAYPEFIVANKLTYYAGKSLADVLSGKTDGMRLLFGSIEGRELVQALYREHTFNRMNYGQMQGVIRRLVETLPTNEGPLKILEVGAGTGGTTYVLAPFLASLGLPVEYTFTDLSSSMVAQARRNFKMYPFMKFAVYDIEKPPGIELCGQHIVLASNAVHATHELKVSVANIHSALRRDGFVMLLEMTEVVPFIDLIFGLLEGWWLFHDGRSHAIVSAAHWETVLQSSGFGHVDWTDGILPENNFQRVIIALASGRARERLPKPEVPFLPRLHDTESESVAREEEAEKYVSQYSAGFIGAAGLDTKNSSKHDYGRCVVITGATGSLGCHLVAQFAESSDIQTVVCINRRRSVLAETRQEQALSSRGVALSAGARAKLRVVETDTSTANLGLSATDYVWLVQHATHIVHNAWPMSGTRPISAFDAQFQTMRNLVDLARDIAGWRGANFRVGFQLISSIGVVGQYPLWSGQTRVPEERMQMRSVLPVGYCEAKWVCERILDETLHRYPERFRPMVVRLGQISGSRTSGYWNPAEHFSFLVKSAQSLRAFPSLKGVLQWVPVNSVAGALMELSMRDGSTDPFYHIDNPVGQPWVEMSTVLAEELGIPPENLIPLKEWVQKVRRSPLAMETDNPAVRVADFLEDHFPRMSCGGLILDTTKAREHSPTLEAQGPVPADIARGYVRAWKEMGYLMP